MEVQPAGSVAPYIVDFLCDEAKLIVEVDGTTHGDAHEVKYDHRRTEHLKNSAIVCSAATTRMCLKISTVCWTES